jgi:hypothetical protein
VTLVWNQSDVKTTTSTDDPTCRQTRFNSIEISLPISTNKNTEVLTCEEKAAAEATKERARVTFIVALLIATLENSNVRRVQISTEGGGTCVGFKIAAIRNVQPSAS